MIHKRMAEVYLSDQRTYIFVINFGNDDSINVGVTPSEDDELGPIVFIEANWIRGVRKTTTKQLNKLR